MEGECTMRQNRKLFFVITTSVILLGLFLVGYFISRPSGFTVVGSTPEEAGTADAAQRVVINFNEELAQEAISVITEPSVGGETVIQGKTLLFQPHVPLNDGQRYTLTLRSVKSASGSTLDEYVLSFVARDNSPMGKLRRTLPYKSTNFTIDYSEYIPGIVVNILGEPIDEQKQQAVDYISSFGVDTDRVPIRFNVARSISENGGAPPLEEDVFDDNNHEGE